MKKCCLIIIDGFGVAEPGPGNARTLAKTPFIDNLETTVPNCLMDASGNAVGLPKGQQGASEPGHLTMGAGRIVWQPLEEINQAIKSGDFYENKVLCAACDRAAEQNKPLHLFGMYSSGGVHSFHEHFHAMLRLAKQKNVSQVYLHLVSDGRDMPEQYFCTDFALLEQEIDEQKIGVVASLVGRYFAMDRDKQYADRTKVSYDLIIDGKGDEVESLQDAVKRWYIEAPKLEDTDYYVRPLKTKAFEAIKEDSVVVMIDFRSDRMIQIVQALEQEDFSEFPRKVRVKDVTCMGPYSDHLPVAFPPPKVKNNLGSIIAKDGLKQLRITETDKFAHVTFFFNSQHHEPYSGETRIMIESPKVPNYAATPAMSSAELTATAVEEINKQEHDFIVLNYPNPDLVGHGGQLDAAIIACETIDASLAILIPTLEAQGYDWILTSDHGNAECMLLHDGKTANPSHTTSQVQTFVKSESVTQQDLDGLTGLKDIAPLCLNILGLEIPTEMN